jgi:hypothetical protein
VNLTSLFPHLFFFLVSFRGFLGHISTLI